MLRLRLRTPDGQTITGSYSGALTLRDFAVRAKSDAASDHEGELEILIGFPPTLVTSGPAALLSSVVDDGDTVVLRGAEQRGQSRDSTPDSFGAGGPPNDATASGPNPTANPFAAFLPNVQAPAPEASTSQRRSPPPAPEGPAASRGPPMPDVHALMGALQQKTGSASAPAAATAAGAPAPVAVLARFVFGSAVAAPPHASQALGPPAGSAGAPAATAAVGAPAPAASGTIQKYQQLMVLHRQIFKSQLIMMHQLKRKQEEREEARKHKVVVVPPPPPAEPVAEGGATAVWVCPACTLENSAVTGSCEACGGANPAAPAALGSAFGGRELTSSSSAGGFGGGFGGGGSGLGGFNSSGGGAEW